MAFTGTFRAVTDRPMQTAAGIVLRTVVASVEIKTGSAIQSFLHGPGGNDLPVTAGRRDPDGADR